MSLTQDERHGEDKAGLWKRLDKAVRGGELDGFNFRQSDSIAVRVEALLREAANPETGNMGERRKLLLERLRQEVKREIEAWKEGLTYMFD